MRILFITATRLGDAVLSTGVLDELIRRHPGARVTVACGPVAAPLFADLPGLERIIVLEKMVFSLHWLMLLASCGGTLWDVVVDLRKAPVSYLLPRRRTYRMGRSREPVHRVVKMAEAIGCRDRPPAPMVWISAATRARAARLIPDDGPVLALGPAANWRAKTWRSERFAELVERLTGPAGILPGARVAIFGRDEERPSVLRLIESIPADRRLDLVGAIDLLTVAACLVRSAFYVGNDSGLMHLAAAVGVPTLGLFGPSPELLYAPWGEHCAVVRTALPYDRIFPERFDPKSSDSLMDTLTVEMAETEARRLWGRTRETAA